MEFAFVLGILAWIGLPLLVFGVNARTRGRDYLYARAPLVAAYCAMLLTIEVAGRFGLYSPLAGIPVLIAPPLLAVALNGRAEPKVGRRGFDVSAPDDRSRE